MQTHILTASMNNEFCASESLQRIEIVRWHKLILNEEFLPLEPTEMEHDSTARMLITLFYKGFHVDPTMEDQPPSQTQIARNNYSESQRLQYS